MKKKNKGSAFLFLPIGMFIGTTLGVIFNNIPIYLCGGTFLGLLADVIKK